MQVNRTSGLFFLSLSFKKYNQHMVRFSIIRGSSQEDPSSNGDFLDIFIQVLQPEFEMNNLGFA